MREILAFALALATIVSGMLLASRPSTPVPVVIQAPSVSTE